MSTSQTENYSTKVYHEISGKNHSELLLKSFQLQKAAETSDFVNQKNETMCRKCLTIWSAGQFSLEIQPGNHKRKLRRKFLIEKYTKKLKETSDSKTCKTIQKIIARMTRENNHVAVYKCLICNYKSKIILYKPMKQKVQKPEVEQAKQEVPSKPVKEKGTKKKKKKPKDHGLNLPTTSKSTPQPPSKSQKTNKNFDQKNQLFKLAEMLKSKSAQSSGDKLKTMLK